MLDLQKKIEALEARVSNLEQEIKLLKGGPPNEIKPDDSGLSINVPHEQIESIVKLSERKKFPILWSYSNKPIMSITEFLTACANKGCILSHSWIPSEGGNFKTHMVKTGLFRETKLQGNDKEKFWQLTDVGKLKVTKMISELKS